MRAGSSVSVRARGARNKKRRAPERTGKGSDCVLETPSEPEVDSKIDMWPFDSPFLKRLLKFHSTTFHSSDSSFSLDFASPVATSGRSPLLRRLFHGLLPQLPPFCTFPLLYPSFRPSFAVYLPAFSTHRTIHLPIHPSTHLPVYTPSDPQLLHRCHL